MDPWDVATEFVEAEFPLATIAIVAGSTAQRDRRATSDIDLLLIGPEEMFPDGTASMSATFGSGGEVIEVFAYTPVTFDEWAERGVSQFRPVIVDMLVGGSAIRDDGSLSALRRRWGPVLDAGARPSAKQLAMKRYIVTDVWDDLHDARDPLETRVLMSTLFRESAELALLTNSRWLGTGKYLPRRLREWDAVRSGALADPYLAGDQAALLDAAKRELDAAGGRVQVGHVR